MTDTDIVDFIVAQCNLAGAQCPRRRDVQLGPDMWFTLGANDARVMTRERLVTLINEAKGRTAQRMKEKLK
jgi:hypothetical protein